MIERTELFSLIEVLLRIASIRYFYFFCSISRYIFCLNSVEASYPSIYRGGRKEKKKAQGEGEGETCCIVCF